MSAAAEGVFEFRMPSMGADMEAGKLTRWLVKPGDRVAKGEIVAIVETEKADIDVEIFTSGLVEELLVAPGVKVPVGTPLARLRGEAVAAPPVVAAPAPAPAVAAPAALPTAPAAPRPAGGASPAARARAIELGVDLAALRGSGPGGAIVLADVEAAAAPPAPATPAPARGARRALAAAMERSNREIPHYYLAMPIDLAPAAAWLDAANQSRPVTARLLPAALLLKAVALAARRVPEMNGFWIDGAFQPADAVHLGVAISRRQGEVVVPALHDVDSKSLADLMAALSDLVARARAGSLRSSELVDATLSVTALGELGADAVYGVIYPPQVALVGFGRIVTRPWVVEGRIEARPIVEATLAADHRASDGFRGGRFLAAIDDLLQHPENL